jgi:hypothetical protein
MTRPLRWLPAHEPTFTACWPGADHRQQSHQSCGDRSPFCAEAGGEDCQLRKDQHAGPDDGAAASRRVTPAGGEHVTGARNDPPPHRYRIRVRGHLGETIRGAFPALQARASGGDTVLTGPLPDRAALYGVLAQIEALGLELLEVRRLPPA